jgi:hypothetical protein
METQSSFRQLGNQRSTRKAVKKFDAWIPRKPVAFTFPTYQAGKARSDGKTKNSLPQRMVSTASSAETMTSQEDYGSDTDCEDEDTVNEVVAVDVKTQAARTDPPVTLTKKDNNEAEKDAAEACLHYEILLWNGCSLGGVSFASCDLAGYPYVRTSDGNESLPGMWNIQEGDFLIAMNECSTHISLMSYESVLQVVANGARPAVLRFRRPTVHEQQRIPTQRRKPASEERLGRRRNRERLEKSISYVIWRESDGPLGVSLKKQRDSMYPFVADMNRGSVVRRHASIGDLLISINQHDICKLDSKRWLQLLQFAPKPLVLTFRRLGAPPNQKGARTLDV